MLPIARVEKLADSLYNLRLQQTIGPVTRHADACPAPDPLSAEANVRAIEEELWKKRKPLVLSLKATSL